MKKFLITGLVALIGGVVSAQISAAESSFKRHEIGLQANGLINAVLSGNSTIDNPYTFRYNYLINQQNAISLGAGFTYGLTEQEAGGEVRESNLDLRLGYLYFHNFSEKLRIGFGGDIGIQRYNTRSITPQVNIGFGDSTVLRTAEINNMLVVGPRITICYHLTDYLSIGTEANYYFMSGIERTELTATSYNRLTGIVTNFFEDSSEDSLERFRLGVPVAVYLTLRL